MTSLISDERIQLDNGDVLSMVMHKQQICKWQHIYSMYSSHIVMLVVALQL